MTDLEKARKLLPCTCVPKPDTDVDHFGYCVSRYRPIVAAALKAEREQEREACLKIVQDTADTPGQGHGFIVITAQKLADRIRARGEP